MLEWKIEIIGYKEETISEDKWSRHYERLYKTCEKDNPDVTNALFAYKDFNESDNLFLKFSKSFISSKVSSYKTII